MKTKLLKITLIPLLLAVATSCSSQDNSSSNSLDEYEITKGESLENQKVYQVSPAFASAAFNYFNTETGWHWDYDMNPIFFNENCPLSKQQLQIFASTYGYSQSFEDTYYSCLGTNYYTYSEKISGYILSCDMETPDEDGIYAAYWIYDLTEYTFTSKNGKNSFKIYGGIGGARLEFRKAYSD